MTTWNKKETFDNKASENIGGNNDSYLNTEPYPNEIQFKEMFENLYQKDKQNIEGFNFISEFDLHKKPKKKFNKNPFSAISKIIEMITNYILSPLVCPIYKIDDSIFNGIQNLLSVFLAVECGDSSMNYFNKKTEVIDMTDLIDPELLYSDSSLNVFKHNNSSKESFENKVNCEQQQAAKDEIKQNSKIIKEEIYKIIFLPVVFHIFYNMFYMFCFRNNLEKIASFIDIEEKFYKPYIEPTFFNFFFELLIKPVAYLTWILNYISHYKPLRKLTDNYPYIFYVFIFF